MPLGFSPSPVGRGWGEGARLLLVGGVAAEHQIGRRRLQRFDHAIRSATGQMKGGDGEGTGPP
jgi:hypothetical protein